MTDDHAALARFPGVARIFPLPNMVFFPQVVQGLHIFEPRYRQMTADALAGDQLVALVALTDDWESTYDDAPAIEPVGCLGRITQHELLPDGRYNLRLRGLSRVRFLDELPTDKLYRVWRAEPLPDIVPADLKQLSALRKTLAAAVLPRFEPSGPAHAHLRDLFGGDTPLGSLCDMLAYALPLDQAVKMELLAEPHVALRADLLAQSLAVDPDDGPGPLLGGPPAPPAGRAFPPEFSPN